MYIAECIIEHATCVYARIYFILKTKFCLGWKSVLFTPLPVLLWTGNVLFSTCHHAAVCFCCQCVLIERGEKTKKKILKAQCGVVCFFFLFYRDVEGAEPATQGERVYRPENYCWRQRVWSPPKCSSFLQLVFQGPGEKVCLRSPITPPPSPPRPPTTHPTHQLLIQSVLFIGRICVASFFLSSFFFPFPPSSLLQVCEDFGS